MPADTLEAQETSVELLREFERTGRPEPFEAFMRRHASMVYATCLKVTRDPHDAEDATQATFLTLASKSRLNGEIRQPEAWLRKVAHRLALDLIRSKKRRVNRENLRSEMTTEAAPLDSHDHANAGEVKGILNEELAKLPASYRMPLILHYFGGLSRDEMAAQLKLKPSTLGVRLHRAREQLRRKLAARGILLPTVALTALLTEVVRQSVCGHMMTSTAQQASAIAMGHASAPMFAASTGVDSIGSLIAMLSHGKLKVLLSAAIISSAIGMGSAQVRALIPDAIRSMVPSFRLPSFSLPKFEFRTSVPRIASATDVPVAAESTQMANVEPTIASPARFVLATSIGKVIEIQASITASSAVAEAAPEAKPVPMDTVPDVAPANVREAARTSRTTVASASPERRSTAASAPRALTNARASATPTATSNDEVASSSKAGSDSWNGIIPDRAVASGAAVDSAVASSGGSPSGSASSGGGGGGAPPRDLYKNVPTPAPIPDDAPARVTAAVTGTVPALRDGSGNTAGQTAPKASANGRRDRDASEPITDAATAGPAAPKARTVVFDGTSANYGGYADEQWKPTSLNQVVSLDSKQPLDRLAPGEVASGTASTAPGLSFNYPAIPGEMLSVNGARVTLENTAGLDDSPAAIRYVDTSVTAIPALPAEHTFVGVWQLETEANFTSVDLLVRYDDLRASRLGLNERMLKLWVSDGENWSLMWGDPSFGRDINQNLMWVTAGGGVKFFAASTPEPATIAALLGGLSVLSIRRRRA